MKSENILRDILPEILIDNFDIVKYDKTDSQFDIWLNEKKVQIAEDKDNQNIISHGFTNNKRIELKFYLSNSLLWRKLMTCL